MSLVPGGEIDLRRKIFWHRNSYQRLFGIILVFVKQFHDQCMLCKLLAIVIEGMLLTSLLPICTQNSRRTLYPELQLNSSTYAYHIVFFFTINATLIIRNYCQTIIMLQSIKILLLNSMMIENI